MKLLLTILFFPFLAFSQGNNCSNAIALQLDNVCRTYNMSNTAEMSYPICNYGSIGNVLYFSFTTDASATCIEVDISTSVISQADVSLYRSCSPVIDYDTLALCLNDGRGVWSTKSSVGDNPLQPNTTYYLRIRTAQFFNGNVKVCAKKSNNTNYSCANATLVTAMPLTDNNASATPNYTGSSANLCAQSIENVAWYKAVTPPFPLYSPLNNIVNVMIDCDNFDSQQGQTGFQIGQFEGACNTLSVDCKNGYDTTITFYMTSPGTTYYFGIDGMFDANCKYTIWVGLNQILWVDSLNKYMPVERKSEHAIDLFPTHIQINKKTLTQVYDMSGRLLKQYNNVSRIETAGWMRGVYVIATEYQTKKYLKL